MPCADQETFVRGGPTLTSFFFFLRGETIQANFIISGPSMFCWRAKLNAGLVDFSGDPDQYC